MWRKSSFCASSSCVEIETDDTVSVRDSAGNICEFDSAEWAAFIAGVKNGEFDV